MAALAMMISGFELYIIPCIGILFMVGSKIASGARGVLAERFFFATLLLATFTCFRALLNGETQWLVHALSMAILIVGAVSIPATGDCCRRSASRI